MINYKNPLFAIIVLFCPVTGLAQNQLAFRAAEGYGEYTVGGRGCKVYEVTNLRIKTIWIKRIRMIEIQLILTDIPCVVLHVKNAFDEIYIFIKQLYVIN